MPVKIIERGLSKLLKSFSAKKTQITIGVHEADGAKPHNAGDGLTVTDIATIHEFGAPGIPQRSFLRAWFDENESKTKEAVRRMAQAIVKGKYTREQAIELLAQSFVGQIQKRIARGIPPANAPATIAEKGSDKPLIDTGQLRTSISYAIDGALKKEKS